MTAIGMMRCQHFLLRVHCIPTLLYNNSMYVHSREFRENLEFAPLRMDDVIEDHQICVCVRKRPLNKKGTRYRCQNSLVDSD